MTWMDAQMSALLSANLRLFKLSTDGLFELAMAQVLIKWMPLLSHFKLFWLDFL